MLEAITAMYQTVHADSPMQGEGFGTVSVIIPAYNAAGYIKRAVESALAQTLAPLEILVVDDGSKDDTRQIVSGMTSDVVRLIEKENGGSSPHATWAPVTPAATGRHCSMRMTGGFLRN